MNPYQRTLLAIFSIGLGFSICAAVEQNASSQTASKKALESLNEMIGEWRGTGQLRRGSNSGAWRQSGQFEWDFSSESPAIRYIVNDGKLTTSASITWSRTEKFSLQLLQPDGTKRTYRGDWDEGKLVVISKPDDDGIRYRITLTPLNEKRLLVLHEKTSPSGSSFFRIAEVGNTRAGTRLAIPGGGMRECVVTGGTAQTAVTHNGETYYVCCTGCKQAFEDDPEGIIADFKSRLSERLKTSD
ncbi:YHS domain protein [Thalassoglobus neptunius]|uniref:YHS domain protein n=1 Tax=Thalassoglobus neptunius TaxID=1938619 RepID=A0A5C5X870_9PLAN|nr:hypothetical protein [Thalassoglobus neptunius]TWT58541.1 YHS domain protein [Thalassoglobus neptunius]